MSAAACTRFVAATAAAILSACATARPVTVDDQQLRLAPATRPAGAPTSNQMVTAAQIASVRAGNLLDALQRIHPEFLLARGQDPDAPNGYRPGVYMNGAPHGDFSVLSSIPAALVQSVQYVRPSEAMVRFDHAYKGGLLLVVTRKEP